MKVKLLVMTPFITDVIYTACKTCYSYKTPNEIFYEQDPTTEELKCSQIKLINKVWSSGHTSTAEHVYFTFAVEGVSRALLAQLSRHRFISLSVQSQRYVDMGNPDFVVPENLDKPQKETIGRLLNHCRDAYNQLTADGMKKEDARSILPNATCTNLVMSMNLRELMHVCNLRLCTRAQKEIREMFKLVVKEVLRYEDWLEPYLVPQCEKLGYCPEAQCCGRKKKLKELINEQN